MIYDLVQQKKKFQCPEWWKNLKEEKRNQIIDSIKEMLFTNDVIETMTQEPFGIFTVTKNE